MKMVTQLDPSDERWIAFIESIPQANIFHHPAWSEILSRSYGYRPFTIAVLGDEDRVCAGVPMMEVSSPLKNRRWVSLPFSDYCNPLYQDEESLAALVESSISLSEAHQGKKVEIRWSLPDHPHVHRQNPFVLHTLPLAPDPKLMAKRANRQQMQNVRTAGKNDIQIMRGNSLAETRLFYHLHCLTRRKHGTPVQPWKFFKLLTENLLQKGLGFILLAYKDKTCLAAGLFMHFNKTLTYKYSASLEEGLKLRPNHMLTWNAIQWGCENGFMSFDFGRADLGDEGLSEYKRRWGAEETPLIYSYLPSAPKIARGSYFMSALQTVIRKSPLWVCRLTGELLYRYVG